MMSSILFIIVLLFLPEMALATNKANSPLHMNLTSQIVGYLSLTVTVVAYFAAMSEDLIELSKSKLIALGSSLVWFAICIYLLRIA
jgi:hypothetical protein